jgi:outer membrane protein W
MKKCFYAFAMILCAYSVNAQNLSFGPSVGIEHSWITGTKDLEFKPGFSVGGVLTWSATPHWGFGGDIRVSFMEGVRTSFQTAEKEEHYKMNATYLRVPLKATYFFGEYGQKFRPKIYAGPSFGYLLGGETTVSNSTLETKTKDLLNDFDWGFIAGTGFNYRLKSNTWLNIDLAYTNGLHDVTKAGGYQANRNVSVNAGVTFPLGTVK